jgi:hypothetical protein
MRMRTIIGLALALLALLALLGTLGTLVSCNRGDESSMAAKPVIYLYPTEPCEVSVALDLDGLLDVTYPDYRDGWQVYAYPDGTLVNSHDGKEYSYLFWEGFIDQTFDFSSGFVVKGSDTADFLQEKLAYMGLEPKEYNEFIVYWLPKMQDNAYNLISFQEDSYTDAARLTISPRPDSILRVFMAFKPLNEPVDIAPQELQRFERTGFSVVEWGGTGL